MNRRERKQMEKNLGLKKHYAKMTREQRFEKMRDNQENGRRLEAEMKQKVAISLQSQEDEKESNSIANLAEGIAKAKQIPFIDAMEEAKVEYNIYNK